MRNLMAALLAALAAAGPGAAQALPDAVKARMQEMARACEAAGGRVGQPTGQGQFVLPMDYTGDGATDFLVSEGNFPCLGQPGLFRPGGLARVELFLADGRLAFADRLLGWRIVRGNPPRVEIARQGPACGGPARCGDELRWNAAAGRFEEHATDGRKLAARPAAGAAAAAAPVPVAPAAPPPVAAAAAAVPPVPADAEARFRAKCRRETLAASGPQAAKWVDGACAEDWKRVAAAQPLAEALLIAHAAGAGPADGLRRALPMVRWAARPEQGEVASGRLGGFGAGLAGAGGRADRFTASFRGTGVEIPVNLPAALEARGAVLTRTSCVRTGVGEGERAWQVALPGRPPFELVIAERTAPTAGAWTTWLAEARLDARPARRGPASCEPFW